MSEVPLYRGEGDEASGAEENERKGNNANRFKDS